MKITAILVGFSVGLINTHSPIRIPKTYSQTAAKTLTRSLAAVFSLSWLFLWFIPRILAEALCGLVIGH